MKVGTDGVLIGAWADVNNSKNVLDIGSGTGLISLMAAQKNQQANIHAVDIDLNCYEESMKNFQQSRWSDRLMAFHNSIQQFARQTTKIYDTIITNPPFFRSGTKPPQNNRQLARHDISLEQEVLIECVNTLLSPDGKMFIILPYSEGQEFISNSNGSGLYLTEEMRFYAKKEKPIKRLLLKFEKYEKPFQTNDLIHYDNDGEWSADYKALTKDFYLKL